MLDALIDQLPGVEMKEGGQIYVNGKFVENLTLNGKDFFGGNHQLLLENLGAYTVKDIAVYDKLGERSKFLGRELPGDKQFTMDVRLKKEYMETWLLNAEGGMGTADRYMGRMFFARSTSHSQVGLFGNFNNLSDQGRPGQHTLWRQANKSGGKQRVQHAGLTYSVDGKAGRVKNSGDMTFARIFTDLQRNTTRMNLLPSGTTYDYSYSNSNTDVLTLAQSHLLIINNKYWQGIVSEKINYQKNDNTQSGVSALFDEEQLNMNRQIIDDLYTSGSTEWKPSLVNYAVNEEIVKGHKLNAFGRATNSFKFKKNADTFRLVMEANYTDEKRDRFNLYNIKYRQNLASDVKLNDYYKSPNNSYYVMANMEYGYSFKSGFAYLSYGFQHDEKNTDQYRYQLDRLAEQGVFGTVPEGFASVMDPLNSHTAHYNTNTNRFGLDVCKSWLAGRVSLRVCSSFDFNNESLAYMRNGNRYNVRKNFFLPSVSENFSSFTIVSGEYDGAYGKAFKNMFELAYGLTPRAPELINMVPVVDDSDPLNIYVGVDNLKTELSHRISLNWRYRPKRANINNTLRLSYGLTSNALTRGYEYDPQTGIRTWRSYNVDGNWTRYATNTFSLVFGKNRQFTLSSESRVENSQAADVIGTTERPAAQFAIKNWLVSQGLKLSWQIGKQRIGVNGSFVWRNTNSEHDDFSSFHATNVNCGVTGNFRLPGNIGLETDFTLYSRNGYADSRLNTNDFVWNARLSYTFGKGHWVAMLDGYDLLHQLSNVTYGITAQARTITYTNTLPRYCLLHLQYKINIAPYKKRK